MLQTDFSNWTVAPSLHWMEAFGSWLRATPSQKRRERSQLTMDAYLSDVRLVAEHIERVSGQAFSPEFLNATDLKAYFKPIEESGKFATYNRKLASVRMLIKWALSVGLIDHDPSEWIPFIDYVRESPRDVSDQERLKLETVAEAGEDSLIGLRDSIIFFLMNDGGLRISEVTQTLLSDLHLDEGYIHVLGKGRKHRRVKIGTRLINKICTWLDRKPDSIDGTLITDEAGLSIGRGQAWRRFKLIAEQAGVNASPHWMRHTYVMRYMAALMRGDPNRWGAALKAVCQQTGDTPEVILAYYTGARESDMRAAAEAM